MSRFSLRVILASTAFLSQLGAHLSFADAAGIEFFETKVRPVLAESCYSCHGAKRQQSNLRLDSLAGIFKGGERGPAVVPGDPEKSVLIQAVRYLDENLQMPPRSRLKEQQLADLVAWVKMGAPGMKEAAAGAGPASKEFDLAERRRHWCYQPVSRPELPQVHNETWPTSSIDYFLLHKLEEAGLRPAPPAGKRAFLRRVTFDLIGLPPTPAEIEAFLADESPRAFEKVVQRLLDSPHYGERWGRHWLDLVRYAETMGHEFDFDIHNVWRYRDYVIRAFNDDVPYDQFVLEHVAGDLLPAPRRHAGEHFNESVIATGFFWLGEGKHSPVDIRQEQADRIDNQIDVFGKTFLAQTLACARCHDHKFDAIPTRDYYSLFGYLKSSRYQQASIDAPERIALRAERLAGIRDRIEARMLEQWLSQVRSMDASRLASARVSLDAVSDQALQGLRPLFKDGFEGWSRSGEAVARSGKLWMKSTNAGPMVRLVSRGAVHSGTMSPVLEGTLRSPTFTLSSKYLYLHVAGRESRVNLVVDGLNIIRDPIYGGLTFELNDDKPSWRVIDASMWVGHRAYLELIDSTTPDLSKATAFKPSRPLESGYFHIDSVLVSDERVTLSATQTSSPESRERLVEQLEAWRSGSATAEDAGAVTLLNWLLENKLLDDEPPAELRQAFAALAATIPLPTLTPALADGTGEDERIFNRGNYRTLGERAPRRLPEVIGGSEQPEPARGSGRLELARRLVDSRNPLLARVLVNRMWKHHFGEGLVRSPDDFGRMGELPTHPELLDYLADRFVRDGWSIKRLHQRMVLSSAYRMSSRGETRAEQVDPQNKLLHRMPLRRLEAEAIRDAILAVSGQLDRRMRGPGVLPYLTSFMEGRGRPQTSGPLDGAGRRSIYLNVRRNFLNPMFLAFDYPIPFSSMGRRSASNVPAQALTLMNDPFVLEQSQRWAERILSDRTSTTASKLDELYLAAYARPCTKEDVPAAMEFLRSQALRHGCGTVDPQVWSDLCHVLLNSKEFLFLQ